MKKIIIPALIAAAALTMTARAPMNGGAQLLLLDRALNSASPSIVPASTEVATVDVLVLVNSDFNEAALAEIGATLIGYVGDVAGVNVPVAAIEALADIEGVEFIEYNEPRDVQLDFARPASQVTEAQDGFTYGGAKHSFDGTGVLTGLMDIGIEPNHLNFLNPDGTTRVKALYIYNSSTPTLYTTPSQITGYTYDTNKESHGTHTSGIMCGGYKGESTYAYITSPTGRSARVTTGDNPYYGVATNSHIAMAAGSTTDANIINAVGRIISLGESMGVPVVVNLSLGSNTGPHDGSDLTNRSLADLAKRGIICISAGNEGEDPLYIKKECTADSKEFKTFFAMHDLDGTGARSIKGTFELWGDDSTPFKVTVALYAKSGGKLTEICTLDASGQAGNSNGSTLFAQNFSGAFSVASGVNNLNNRFYVKGSINCSQRLTGYNLALIVEGTEGHTIYTYGGSTCTFTSNNISGYINGRCDGSINSMVFGKDVISVGSYCSRVSFPALGRNSTGSAYTMQGAPTGAGGISSFSSWGQAFDGKWYPTVCAPGEVIISSLNRYEVSYGSSQAEAAARATNGTATDYWGYMQGTSMSSPYCAGVVALWLQADPSLTSADVIKVIEETSISQSGGGTGGGIIDDDDTGDTSNTDKYRWGAGKLDAVAGLKYILDHRSGVGTIFDDNSDIIVTIDGDACKVYAVGASRISARLYNLSGVAVAQTSTAASETVLSTANVASGIYLLSVETPNSSRTEKIVIR